MFGPWVVPPQAEVYIYIYIFFHDGKILVQSSWTMINEGMLFSPVCCVVCVGLCCVVCVHS